MGFLFPRSCLQTPAAQMDHRSRLILCPAPPIITSKRKPEAPAGADNTGCVTDFHVTVTKIPDRTNLRDKYPVSLGPAGREGMAVGTRGHSCSFTRWQIRKVERARPEVGVRYNLQHTPAFSDLIRPGRPYLQESKTFKITFKHSKQACGGIFRSKPWWWGMHTRG